MTDLTAGIRLTDTTLRLHVDNGLANSKALLTELKAKFEAMDVTIAGLTAAAVASQQRPLFLDPRPACTQARLPSSRTQEGQRRPT